MKNVVSLVSLNTETLNSLDPKHSTPSIPPNLQFQKLKGLKTSRTKPSYPEANQDPLGWIKTCRTFLKGLGVLEVS